MSSRKRSWDLVHRLGERPGRAGPERGPTGIGRGADEVCTRITHGLERPGGTVLGASRGDPAAAAVRWCGFLPGWDDPSCSSRFLVLRSQATANLIQIRRRTAGSTNAGGHGLDRVTGRRLLELSDRRSGSDRVVPPRATRGIQSRSRRRNHSTTTGLRRRAPVRPPPSPERPPRARTARAPTSSRPRSGKTSPPREPLDHRPRPTRAPQT